MLGLAKAPLLPRPVKPVCVVGDVHGCLAALELLLERISEHSDMRELRLVFVGDLVDRGPDSAGVLARVIDVSHQMPGRVISLMGNHERMMLDVLQNKSGALSRWVDHGGAETLTSYGVSPFVFAGTPGDNQRAVSQALRAALPSGTADWLEGRPCFWRDGDLAVSHAVGDPLRGLEDQQEDDLIWGHPRSLTTSRIDGLWMVHGHWIHPEVTIKAGRIAVDTGAYDGGPLSAVLIDQDGARVLQASS